MSVLEHDLYMKGDPDAPAAIKDANGEVVLGLCRRCGRAEAELAEPCVTKHFSSRCMPGRPPREVGEVDGVVIQGMVDCSKAGMLRADDATEHMKAQEADWQRVCDALGAEGQHMDPDDVIAAIERLKPSAFTEWMDRDWPLWRNDPNNPNVARLRRLWDHLHGGGK